MNKEETELSAFRLPKILRAAARRKCSTEDITFSQLMRRALRRDLGIEDESSNKRRDATQ